VRQYNQGKTDRNLEIVAKHTELDLDLLREACWPSIHNNGMINVQSVIDFQDWGLEQNLLDGLVSEEQFWDSSFAQYANKVLGESAP
jgi:NitT/TauT family transport system substrate-binding protein